MERLRLFYEQIEEARRLMLSGTLPNVRLALILLDNAAELLMYRELSYIFAEDDFYAKLRASIPRGGTNSTFLSKYTEEERRRAKQEFKPMVKILQLRLGMISDKQAIVLRVCHEIRRDAFHRGEMNPTILRPVTELLFLTVAELARAFPVHSYSIQGGTPDRENADFLARFDVHQSELGDERGREKMYSKLVGGIAFDARLRETLSLDLVGRIDQTIEGLSYQNDGSAKRDEIDYNLRYTQFWKELGAEVARRCHEEGRAPKDDLDKAYAEWSENSAPRFTMDKLERWRRHAAGIAKAKHPADAVARYRAIEQLFAPLEEDVGQAVAQYDEHINMLVHDRRLST
jgi:hypothetical protein